jgi:hypothetical protein
MYSKYVIIILIIFIILKRKFIEYFNNSFQGPFGDIGDPGYQGDIGYTGFQGDPGPPGKTGIGGIQGKKGHIGLGGSMGDIGSNGNIGDQGPPGKDGNTGMSGDKGPDGPPGENGIRGSKGPVGLRGLQGSNGEQGKNGRTGTEGVTFAVKKELAHPNTRSIINLSGNVDTDKRRLSQTYPGSTIDTMRYPTQPIPVFGDVQLEFSPEWWAKCAPGEFFSELKIESLPEGAKYQGKTLKDGNKDGSTTKNHMNLPSTTEQISLGCSKAIMKNLVEISEEEFWNKYPRCCASKNSCTYKDGTIGQWQSKSKFECETTFKGYWDTSRYRCCEKKILEKTDIRAFGYCYTNQYLDGTSSTPNSGGIGGNSSTSNNIYNDGSIYQKVYPEDKRIVKEQVLEYTDLDNKLACHNKCKNEGYKYSSFLTNSDTNAGTGGGTGAGIGASAGAGAGTSAAEGLQLINKCHCSASDEYIDNELGTGIYDVTLLKPPPPLPVIDDSKLDDQITDIECINKCEDNTNGVYTGSIKKGKGCFCSLKECINIINDKNFKTFVGSDYSTSDCSFEASDLTRRNVVKKEKCDDGLWSKPIIKCPSIKCMDKFIWERMNPRCCKGFCLRQSYKVLKDNGEPNISEENKKGRKQLDDCINGDKFVDPFNKDTYCCETESCNYDDTTSNQRLSATMKECSENDGAWNNDCKRCQKIYNSPSKIYKTNINDLVKCKDNDGDVLNCIADYNFILPDAKVYE